MLNAPSKGTAKANAPLTAEWGEFKRLARWLTSQETVREQLKQSGAFLLTRVHHLTSGKAPSKTLCDINGGQRMLTGLDGRKSSCKTLRRAMGRTLSCPAQDKIGKVLFAQDVVALPMQA